MVKLINLEEIEKKTKKFYEICSDISISQKELDEMLVAIEKNSMEFEKGKISKDLFKYNEEKMKKDSAKIIKGINDFIVSGDSLINKINKEIETQKIDITEKRDRIKEIKKLNVKKTKAKKKKVETIVETPKIEKPIETVSTEKKLEQGI